MLQSGFSNDEINNLFTFINHVFEIKDRNLRYHFYEEAKGMALSNRSYNLTDYDMVVAERKAEEIAKNMLKNNEPVEKVSSYTGLTIAEVEELKKNLK